MMQKENKNDIWNWSQNNKEDVFPHNSFHSVQPTTETMFAAI